MAPRLIPGLYEQLVSRGLDLQLRQLDPRSFRTEIDAPAESESARLLAHYMHRLLLTVLEGERGANAPAKQLDICLKLLEQLQSEGHIEEGDQLKAPTEVLTQLVETIGLGQADWPAPSIPLGTGDLLVNAPGEPGLGPTLATEIPSANRIDLLCAFIRWNGFRILEPALRQHIERGGQLRVITTTYLGATERRAIDLLVELGAKLKVSYETRTTRLHAKAWLFDRDTGFSTAYVGSSNLSHSALLDGLEWNVRLSQSETPALLDKFRATFAGYWEDPQFEEYDPKRDAERFDASVKQALGPTAITSLPSFELRPYPFQVEILDSLKAERERHGRHRNLVVAATGTGKTMIAAFDYRRLAHGRTPPRLLFVAHRREILTQSRDTFRAVLRDASFGELYVDGERPVQGAHVFASVQALAHVDLARLPPNEFAVLIIDEFHHAQAPTYRRLLEHLEPQELLGLTATPERADGQSVLEWFDGRIAAELRLWEALERGFLCPFQYFGVHDGVDLSTVQWNRGGYDVAQLEKIYTASDRRVALVVKALRDRVLDTNRMRALGFCVSVEHAHYMARRFTEAGIPAIAITGDTDSQERVDGLRRLRDREINVVFAVDIFNEGVDVPEIDTVLFLRPTESATVFLQQLGRGLRLAEGKDCLTALDFIGHQHDRFRFDLRFRAITGLARAALARQVETGFSYLPPGSSIQLDAVSKEVVLESVRRAVGLRIAGLADELRVLPPDRQSLAAFLTETGLSLEDVYRTRGWTWAGVRRAAGLGVPEPGPDEEGLGRAIAKLLSMDDPEWLRVLAAVLASPTPPDPSGLSREQQRIVAGLHFALWSAVEDRSQPLLGSLERLWRHPAILNELRELLPLLEDRARVTATPLRSVLGWSAPVPLSVHSSYRLDDILVAFGLMTPDAPHRIREGVKYDEETRSDLFFVTLTKNEKHYSPTTRYRDYAISPQLFHWESQSTTSVASRTGQRYINHRREGTHVLLFVRHAKKTGGTTEPYVFLGPADYVSHGGDRPIAITWRLRVPMPADFYQIARVAAG